MTDVPSLDDALLILADISEAEEELTGATKLAEAELDSLDVLEWMFQLEIETDDVLDDENFARSLDTMTLAELYETLTSAAVSSPPTEAATP